jgi:hypothetical protein
LREHDVVPVTLGRHRSRHLSAQQSLWSRGLVGGNAERAREDVGLTPGPARCDLYRLPPSTRDLACGSLSLTALALRALPVETLLLALLPAALLLGFPAGSPCGADLDARPNGADGQAYRGERDRIRHQAILR